MKNYFKRLIHEEDGIGVVEIILILVVLIGLVIIFKDQIGEIVTNAFSSITENAGEITG